jgi:hypothetical protein
MDRRTGRFLFPVLVCALACTVARAQVFVVGEKTATADVNTQFTPTHLPLPGGQLGERGQRELVRDLEAEQGFAHRPLPMGSGLTLQANGQLQPGPEQYKKMLYQKGQSSGVGDRVVVTALSFKRDRIIIDLNGGPYAKHRFLSHVSFNDAPVTQVQAPATGSRVTLVFEGGVPDISAPEVKALLLPIIDFGAKTSAEAYAETLPTPLKDAIALHEAKVGMNQRMVLAALGAPDSKVREHENGDPDAPKYEEWIYGQIPQTVRFVRFRGDRVVMVKICALGKPVEIHSEDEMDGYKAPPNTREIAMGDAQPGDTSAASPPPTLRKPGEAVPADQPNKVRFPDDPDAKTKVQPIPPPPSQSSPGGPSPNNLRASGPPVYLNPQD